MSIKSTNKFNPIESISRKIILFISVDGGYGKWSAYGKCNKPRHEEM